MPWLVCCLLLVSTLATAAPSETEQRFRAEVTAFSAEAGDEYARGTAAGESAHWDEALAHFRRAAELAPKCDHPHRRICGVLANLGRNEEAIAACETALSLAPQSPYDKMALANALAQAKRDLPRAVALAKEALPEVAADPIALGMYCTVLLDARALPGVDAQLNDCIAHLYVLDPAGMESNYLGAVVAALRGHRELAHKRLDAAKSAGLPDAEYTQLAAQIDGAPHASPPAAVEPLPSHRTRNVIAIIASIIGIAAVTLLAVRLSHRRSR